MIFRDVIILLSQLGQQMDKQLVEQIEGIDVILSNQVSPKHGKEEKIGSAVYLRPYQWARTLGFTELDIDNGQVMDQVTKGIPMSKDIQDDSDIISFLPACFHNGQCRKPGFMGKCKMPGERNAVCVYEEQVKVPLMIIRPKVCKTCNLEDSIFRIKKIIPNVIISYLDSKNKKARELIKKFDFKMLPVFLLGEGGSKLNSYKFLSEKGIIEKKGNYHLINPSIAGVSYFINRDRKKNRLDLFVSLRHKGVKAILKKTQEMLNQAKKKIDFNLHFLTIKKKGSPGGFVAPHGAIEVEENKIALCVMKKYPKKMWDFLYCHIDKMENAEWNICANQLGIDVEVINKCSGTKEGTDLLKENISLVEELEIFYGPLFLLENQEIFGINENTPIKEFEDLVVSD